MKKAKLNSNKKIDKIEKNNSEEFTVKKFLIALISILVVFLGFYFLTDVLLSKQTTTPIVDDSTQTSTNEITFNNILKQEDELYYVLAVLPNDENEKNYGLYTSGLTPIYTIDMNDSFNKSHIGKTTSIGDSAKDIIISDSTLFVIEKNKVKSYYVGSSAIKEYMIDKSKQN